MQSISETIEKAISVILSFVGVFVIYWAAKALITLRIENNPKAFTIRGKLITIAYCLIASMVVPYVLYMWGTQKEKALSYFVIIFSATLVAVITCYKKFQVNERDKK
jgi:hypothetical protein